jgi:threonine dehydratase
VTVPLPTLSDVRGAAERLQGITHRTPLIKLPLPGEVYAKAENLQRTNSFKLRGAYAFLASLSEAERARGVVAHSSGNHAQGVACAARLLGVKATIVIPEGAAAIKVERTLAWGAEVVRCPNLDGERERVAQALSERHGYVLVPPFDHPHIIAGQGTVGLEIAAELADVANVLVPVGGGGLMAGIALALEGLAPRAKLIGVEPVLAADAAASFEKGTLERWETELTSRTVADGVRTQSLGETAFALIRRHVARFVTVREEAILEATRFYLREARLVVEPTGALTLAAYRQLAEAGELAGKTVLVVSGGNIAPELACRLLTDA